MSNKLFGAAWCGNCNSTKSHLDAQGIAYDYIDIDEQHELAVENNIRSLPTLITEVGDRAVGLLKIKELLQNVDLSGN